MRSRSRGPSISSARPADQTAQVSTRPSRRRRARVSRRLAPRGLVRTPASFRRDISSCTSGAPSNSRGNCAPAAVGDASGPASSLRPKPCRPAPTPMIAAAHDHNPSRTWRHPCTGQALFNRSHRCDCGRSESRIVCILSKQPKVYAVTVLCQHVDSESQILLPVVL